MPPVPPLPASCSVADVATWLVRVRHNDDGNVPAVAYANDIRQADAVVGLLYAKATEALRLKTMGPLGATYSDSEILSRILGPALSSDGAT